jgi:hypothetical protein
MRSLVLTVFAYFLPAYGSSFSVEDIYHIQKLQNSVVRFIFNLDLSMSLLIEMPLDDICRDRLQGHNVLHGPQGSC